MKPLAKRLLALTGAAAIAMSVTTSAYAIYREDTTYSGVADWALLEVTEMDRLGLIPEELMEADLSQEITRSQMCAIAVATYENVSGEEAPIPENMPFADTDDIDVAKAQQLGIVMGDGNGCFRPDDSLTRAEFFTFVGRYLECSGMDLTADCYCELGAYCDAATLPVWAQEPTRLSVGLEIVRGSGTSLDWQRTASAQEALAMFYRARNASVGSSPADAFTDLASWAKCSVLRMDQLGVIPSSVKSRSMSGAITRQELCQTVMAGYRLLTGLTDEDLGEPDPVFDDTGDIDVLNAYSLGIVSGRGMGTFDPNSAITRQDFFTICANFLRAVDYWYIDDVYCDLDDFTDSDQLAAYAVQPAKVMVAIGAVQGDGAGSLNPGKEISSQEAVVIFNRVIDFYADWSADPVEPEPYEGELVAEYARQFEGCRYVSGRRGPNKFDCSGLVYYVYQQFGYDLEPCAQNQWDLLDEKIEREELLPGDLLFFSRNGRASGIFHIGIYLGDGEFIHAANPRKGVIITDLDEDWYARRYLGAKRAID